VFCPHVNNSRHAETTTTSAVHHLHIYEGMRSPSFVVMTYKKLWVFTMYITIP